MDALSERDADFSYACMYVCMYDLVLAITKSLVKYIMYEAN